MTETKKTSEWDRLYFDYQKEKLIGISVAALEQLVKVPQLKELKKPILLSQKVNHYSMNPDISIPNFDQVYLTPEGVEENYYEMKTKKVFFNLIPVSNYVHLNRLVNESLFSEIVNKYKLSPSELNNLKKDLEF